MDAPTSDDAQHMLQSLADAVEQAATLDWSAVRPEVAVDVAAGVAQAGARLEGVLVGLVEVLEASGAAQGLGWASVKDFLTHLTGGYKGAGPGLVRLSEQTHDLPRLRAAMLAGTVSVSQARVIARRTITLPRSVELRERAADLMVDRVREQHCDATDLDRGFPAIVEELDPDGRLLGADRDRAPQERAAHHARFLSLTPDEVGGVVVRGYGTVEDVELIRATLTPLTAPQTGEPGGCGGDPAAPLGAKARVPGDDHGRRYGTPCPTGGCAHDGRDPRQYGTRLWDALVEVCTRALRAAAGRTDSDLPASHGVTSRVVVTIGHADLLADVSDLADVSGRGEGLLGSGEPLSVAAVRRLSCDAEVLPVVLGSAGQVLDVGRAQRLVTTGIWHALVVRDRHCAFPGCTRPTQVCDAHHILHWVDGGTTSLDNLVLLCRHHHTLTHHSPWRIHLDATTRSPVWTPPPELARRYLLPYVHPDPRARAKPRAA